MNGETAQTVLVVDDEKKIVTMVKDYLEALGFSVHTAGNGPEALERAQSVQPDIIVLDVMMPGLDGWDVTRRVRERGGTPIILLTAKSEEQDKLMGLELGADDYVVKPFSVKELAARIRAVLRRSRGGNSGKGGTAEEGRGGDILRLGGLEVDREKRTLRRDGTSIRLTSLQFDLLVRLVEYPGRVFTRAQLLEALQDHAYEGYERTIDVHIKNLRKAIEPDPADPRYILTVWGVGYKMSEEGAPE
jgi:DNA-binding response OmpR family regulator